MTLSGSLEQDMAYLDRMLGVGENFDVIRRKVIIGGKDACMYLIDGFCKDELLQKILQFFMEITPDKLPDNADRLSSEFTPYVEVDTENRVEQTLQEMWKNLKRIRCSGARRTVLWRLSYLIRL